MIFAESLKDEKQLTNSRSDFDDCSNNYHSNLPQVNIQSFYFQNFLC